MSVTKREKEKIKTAVKSGDRRSELLAGATMVFAGKGFHDAKISDIVREAGVAQGTFYLYFKTKTDVLRALIEGCCDQIIARMSETSACPADRYAKNRREENIRFLEQLFHVLEREQPILKLILSGAEGIDPRIDATLAEFKQTLVEQMKANLQAGIDQGYVRSLNTTIVAEAIIGMVYHLAFERFVRGRRMGVGRRRLAEEIVDFELNGISSAADQSR